jgi:small-conductance mechanosensitive channel
MRGSCIDGMNTAIYKALGRANIEIPFPQRVVTMVGAPPAGPGLDNHQVQSVQNRSDRMCV